MNESLFKVLIAFIGFLGAILTYVIVPFLKAKQGEIKAKLTEKQLGQVEFWTEMAVIAIEKQFENKYGQGSIKKEYVMDFLSDTLSLDNYMTQEQLGVLIDAVVEEVINKEID